MALHYVYNYVEIDDATNMCIGVMTADTDDLVGPTRLGTTYHIVPVYDEEYTFAYYIDNCWYEDAEGTIPWTSRLLDSSGNPSHYN